MYVYSTIYIAYKLMNRYRFSAVKGSYSDCRPSDSHATGDWLATYEPADEAPETSLSHVNVVLLPSVDMFHQAPPRGLDIISRSDIHQ